MTLRSCPFCESAVVSQINHENDSQRVTCPKCGYYHISGEAADDGVPRNITAEEKILFSSYLRNYSTKKNPVWITNDLLSKIGQVVLPYKKMPVLEKLNRIIRYIAEKSQFIGDRVKINYVNDFIIFFCKNRDELDGLMMHLNGQKIIQNNRPMSEADFLEVLCILTVEGWEKYEKLQDVNPFSKKVFVAMNFDKNFDEIFHKAISPACDECGYKAVRVDKTEHNDKICDRIIADIRQSRFIIADFTGQKNGVYFEAGYAQGLGLDVIRSCKKEEIDGNKLHFDIRQYNHIPWETVEDFKKQLVDRIKATIKAES